MEKMEKFKLHFIILLGLLIVFIIYSIFVKPYYYKFNGGKIYFDTVIAERFHYDNSYEIYGHNDHIYISSSDGMKKIDYSGKTIWNKVYAINNPKLISNGKYMVVYSVFGKEAYIFDEDGFLFDVHYEQPIIMGDVSIEGSVAFVLESNGQYTIETYKRNGERVAGRKTYFEKNGYPIELELSSDGGKMITSYLLIDDGTIGSEVTVFDFSEKEETDSEKILGGITNMSTIIPEIEFFDDKSFVTVGDNKLDFYQINKTPKIIKTLEINNKIEKVAFNNSYLILYLGELIVPSENDLSNHIVVVDKQGKIVNKYKVEDRIKSVISESDFYYLVKTNSLECYSENKRIWASTMHKDIKSIIRINKREFLLLNNYGYEIIKVKDI